MHQGGYLVQPSLAEEPRLHIVQSCKHLLPGVVDRGRSKLQITQNVRLVQYVEIRVTVIAPGPQEVSRSFHPASRTTSATASHMSSVISNMRPNSLKEFPQGSARDNMCLLSLAGSKATWFASSHWCISFWHRSMDFIKSALSDHCPSVR